MIPLLPYLATLLLYGACPSVRADLITYDVNMSGFTEGANGPVAQDLSVVGTITYDTTAQLITASNLSILDPTVLAVLPSALTEQTLTSDYLNATPTALYAVPHAGSGTLQDSWGTVSGSTYGFDIFDNATGSVFVEVTGPPSIIKGFHLGGFGEDGIFGSPTAVLIGTAASVPEPSGLVLSCTAAFCFAGYLGWRRWHLSRTA
jgi:hypothetical protein